MAGGSDHLQEESRAVRSTPFVKGNANCMVICKKWGISVNLYIFWCVTGVIKANVTNCKEECMMDRAQQEEKMLTISY